MPKRKRSVVAREAKREKKSSDMDLEEKKETAPGSENPTPEAEEKKNKRPKYERAKLERMSIAELNELCKAAKVEVGGPSSRKKSYISALLHADEPEQLKKQQEEMRWNEWRKICLVGTEWDNYDGVFDLPWDFDHLEQALEPGGDLYQAGAVHPVYLFGGTEPQLVYFGQVDEKGNPIGTLVNIPVIVAVLTTVPLPNKVGLKSVQKEVEEIVPMSELKMDWVPYYPSSITWRMDPTKFRRRALILQCNLRHPVIHKKKEEELVRWNYALPYVVIPRLQEAPVGATEVESIVAIEGRGIHYSYDWEMDDLDDVVEQLLKDNELGKEHEAEIRENITTAVNERKAANRAEREAFKQKMSAFTEEEKAELNKIRTIKFYPQNSYPDLSHAKSSFINRYFGHASEIR